MQKFRIVRWIVTVLLLQYDFDKKNTIINPSVMKNWVSINVSSNKQYQSFHLLSIQPTKVSSEIIINGLNNANFRKKIRSLFGMNKYANDYIKKIQIECLINKLKLSGFFEYVSFNIYYLGKHQVIIINLIPNPILNKVYINNYQDKLIPLSFILFLFRSQLGYPKSFSQIYESMNQMVRWYHIRGYICAKISLDHKNLKSNSLILNINEGKIDKVDIISYIQSGKLEIKNNSIISIKKIIKILNISPNTTLNIYSLEQGILKLKLQKIISQCHYRIISNYNNKIALLLKITIFNDKVTYIFANKIIIKNNYLKSLGLLTTYALDYILLNNVLSDSLFHDNIIMPHIYCNNSQLYTSMSKHDNILYKSFYKKNIFFLKEISELYLIRLILIAGDNFGFRHCIEKKFILDINFTSLGEYFNLRYDNPSLSILNCDLELLSCSIFQYIYHSIQSNCPMFLYEKDSQYLSSLNTIFYHKGMKIQIQNKYTYDLSCIKEIVLQKISKQFLILHNYLSWQNLYYLIDPCSVNYLIPNFKQVYLNKMQNFLQFSVKFMYIKNNFSGYQSQKNKLILQSLHFIPSIIQKYNHSFNQYLNHTHSFKFKATQSNKINLFYKLISKQVIISKIEILASIGSNYHLPFSERFFVINPDRLRIHKDKLLYLPRLKMLVLNFDYHVLFLSKNSIFLFFDCIYNISHIKNYASINILYSSYDINKLYLKFSYGLGLQIQTPIRQIPPLRLEYGFNFNKNNNCYFHLRMNK